ncbi:hypothetical protein HD806DRAFT_505400 [Xylariaceae sp. AK1471]|nr:hypothetical protein HD806DRAFT_505400 [Xylariaceae sp. AK1471]
MRAQSAVTCLSLTMPSEKPEKVASQGNRSPLDSIDTALLLASKPSLLSTSIEELAKCNALLAPRGRMSYACTCRPSRIMSRRRNRWGYFLFHYETSSTNKHLPDCLFSQIDGDEKAFNVTVEYSGFRRLLQKAVVLSYHTVYGAGGRSISPSFTYYPSIDQNTALLLRS